MLVLTLIVFGLVVAFVTHGLRSEVRDQILHRESEALYSATMLQRDLLEEADGGLDLRQDDYDLFSIILRTSRMRGVVAMRVFDSAPPDMRMIWEASAAHGDKPYIVFEDEEVTYTEAHTTVRALAHTLTELHGVGAGDRVAIAMRNYPEWALAYWATISLGAAVVGMNAWWTTTEMDYALADSQPNSNTNTDIHAHSYSSAAESAGIGGGWQRRFCACRTCWTGDHFTVEWRSDRVAGCGSGE